MKQQLQKTANKPNSLSKNDFKYVAKPLAFLIISLVVVGVVVSVGTRQVKAINNKINTAEKLQNILTQNVKTLSSVDDEIGSQQDFIEIALPVSNAAVYFISQIKSLALDNSLIISNIRTGISSDQGSEIYKAGVSFDIEGSVDSIIVFTNSLAKVLPIGNLNKVKTVLSGGIARSSLTVDVYSSLLPEKIPSLTSPIVSLTTAEKSTLLELVNFILPKFIKPEAQTPTVRENPFN